MVRGCAAARTHRGPRRALDGASGGTREGCAANPPSPDSRPAPGWRRWQRRGRSKARPLRSTSSCRRPTRRVARLPTSPA
eukprot:10944908-Lingulodinium_polyedra.AAC.1